jgi:hypothetical protein
MDLIFGMRKNIAPSFLANKSTSDMIDDIEEENEIKKVSYKKQKVKNNVKVMATAISEMNQTCEKIWEKKISIEIEKMNKNYELEMERIRAEREKWAYEREKEEREREKIKMEFELRIKELELKYQKRN